VITSLVPGRHGDRVGAAVEELHRAETNLAHALLGLADQHKVDHEVFHVARDIARWSQQHVAELARVGESYELHLDPELSDRSAVVSWARQRASEMIGRTHQPALLLIADLRRVHLAAVGVSLDWEVLAQTAQALKDADLLGVAQRCHPQTLRQMRWANAKVKELSAQAMVAR
jgi:hypothetical protein